MRLRARRLQRGLDHLAPGGMDIGVGDDGTRACAGGARIVRPDRPAGPCRPALRKDVRRHRQGSQPLVDSSQDSGDGAAVRAAGCLSHGSGPGIGRSRLRLAGGAGSRADRPACSSGRLSLRPTRSTRTYRHRCRARRRSRSGSGAGLLVDEGAAAGGDDRIAAAHRSGGRSRGVRRRGNRPRRTASKISGIVICAALSISSSASTNGMCSSAGQLRRRWSCRRPSSPPARSAGRSAGPAPRFRRETGLIRRCPLQGCL